MISDPIFWALAVGVPALTAFAVCLLAILTQKFHATLTADMPGSGPQKMHSTAVPRVGGLGVAVGMVAGAVGMEMLLAEVNAASYGLALLGVCLLPAFAVGFVEDLTKRIGVFMRLLVTMVSAGMAFVFVSAQLDRVGVPGLDSILQVPIISAIATVICVSGVAHALNIVDGFNGLAGGISIIALAAFTVVAGQVGDNALMTTCLIALAAVTGFLLLNYPNGRLFLGDGGAYLIGALLGIVAVLLVARNEQVSAWFPLLVLAHPIWETLYSSGRRLILRRASPGDADGLHLHTLFYRRLTPRLFVQGDTGYRGPRHALVAPFFWFISGCLAIAAGYFYDDQLVLMSFTLTYVIGYGTMYTRIVRFRGRRYPTFSRRVVSVRVDE